MEGPGGSHQENHFGTIFRGIKYRRFSRTIPRLTAGSHAHEVKLKKTYFLTSKKKVVINKK
jgi:hypothetical protein